MAGPENATEETSLVKPQQPPPAQSAVVTFLCCSSMISISVLLINVNKYIMNKDRFPYSMALVMAQMVIGTILSGSLFIAKPSFFPALTDPASKITVDLRFMATMFLPIAFFFSSGLILSNAAYSHLGLAFIQMIKETNIVWVYLLSVLARTEALSKNSVLVVIVSIVGMTLTVHGERYFTILGFMIQLSAIMLESLRIIFQGALMQDKKFDPLSYVLIASPTCGILVFIFALIMIPIPHKSGGFALPHWSEVLNWAPWLILSGFVAFCLNINIALVIKRVGGMSYIISQLVKDVVAVLVSVLFLGETVGGMQGTGFGLQLLCVLTWSLMKSFPKHFESGILPGLLKCSKDLVQPDGSESKQASNKV